jgi:hypothetical protein
MVTKQDFTGAEAYIARADRVIEKHRGLIGRSRNPQNVAAAHALVDVLTAFRTNVENRYRRLQRDAARQDKAIGDL